MNHHNFSFGQLFGTVVIVICFILVLVPIFRSPINGPQHDKVVAFNNLKKICLAMQDYSNVDTKRSRMPYPVAKRSFLRMPRWGERSVCWSPEIVKMLFKKKYLKKSNKSILVLGSNKPKNFKSMVLTEDLAAAGDVNKMRWKKDEKLDFQVYCAKSLTNAASGNMVLGITYDQPDINNCLFDGKGWVVFFMDGTGGWKSRKQFAAYDFKNKSNKLVNTVGKGAGITAAKAVDLYAKVRKVFGVDGNGGSTEVLGMKTTSAIYRAFVVDGK